MSAFPLLRAERTGIGRPLWSHGLIAKRRSRPLFGRGAQILRRPFDLDAERLGGVPAPVRVVKKRARQRDHVGLAVSDDGFGLLRGGDQADRAGRDTDLALDLLGERNVEAGDRGRALVRAGFFRTPAGREKKRVERAIRCT